MRPEDFDLFAKVLKENSGLVLTRDKAYLLDSRLTPVARKHRLGGLEDIAAKLKGRPDKAVLNDVVEAMTTNESSFFRDTKPFDQFRKIVLPALLAARAGTKRLRIWSAASSSGQEAYSLAMILKEEAAKVAGWKIEIVGTDLSAEMVERSKSGTYSQFEVQRGLPITHLVKYFKQAGDRWQINQDLRSMVTFKTYNLLHDLKPLGQFDIIFCRNVLIYFDQPTKTKVLAAIGKSMPTDGYLFLGGAETVLGITTAFKPLDGQRGVYVPAAAASVAPQAVAAGR